MFCLPPTSRPRIAIHERGVALDVAVGSTHLAQFDVPVASRLLVDHVEQPERHLPLVLVQRQVAPPARRRRLRTDVIVSGSSRAGPALTTRRADAAGLRRLRLEHVPVGDEHVALREVRHQVRRHQVALAVEARFAQPRIQLRQPAADRHVRADDQDDVGVARVGAVVDLVEDAPRREHPHHRRLARAGGHLAGVAPERLVAQLAFCSSLGSSSGTLDALQEVAPRLVRGR